MNLNKSTMCFSPNTNQHAKGVMQGSLGISMVNCHEKYPGLPIVVGRNKKRMFRQLKDRAFKKLKEKKEGALSKAGK